MQLQGFKPPQFTRRAVVTEALKRMFDGWDVTSRKHRDFRQHIEKALDSRTVVVFPLEARKVVSSYVTGIWVVEDIFEYPLPRVGSLRGVLFEDSNTSRRYILFEAIGGEYAEPLMLMISSEQFDEMTAQRQAEAKHYQLAPSTLAELRSRSKEIGINVRWNGQWAEYRVAPWAGKPTDQETVASYTNDLDDAWGTALQMSVAIKKDPRFANA